MCVCVSERVIASLCMYTVHVHVHIHVYVYSTVCEVVYGMCVCSCTEHVHAHLYFICTLCMSSCCCNVQCMLYSV